MIHQPTYTIKYNNSQLVDCEMFYLYTYIIAVQLNCLKMLIPKLHVGGSQLITIRL